MATQAKKDDYCLECHWESLHLDGEKPEGSPKGPLSHWDCPVEEHHHPDALCDIDETCCDADNCSITCPSICDGFLDCDDSAACSVTNCEDNGCHDTIPVCFDNHCLGDNPENMNSADHTLEALFGLGLPTISDKNDLLPTAPLEQPQIEHLLKASGHPATNMMHATPCTSAFFAPDSMAITHCHTDNISHYPCHDLSHPTHEHSIHQSLPLQTNVNPAEVFHMLGMCPDFSNHFHVHEAANCPDSLNLNTERAGHLNAFTCLHFDQNSMNNFIKNSGHMASSIPARGPCRSIHRCRAHSHAHVHPYSPYSRHSRSSFSSQLLSSPGDTPPPLDGGPSSVLTSPDFSPTETELYTCKWAVNSKTCGATFPDACALQEHLVSCHMGTINGAKGVGYYCCWEGCNRPTEPFSQKSKLQGHFLTHSNYKNFKCSVCGKRFARQATLERHERSHRGEKPFKCTECGKSFTDSSELKTHSRTHTGEKPFKCSYPGCKFQTGDSSNMSSHRLTHGERRHKCQFPGCSKSFTRPDQLKRHMKSTHKQNPLIFSPSSSDHQFALPFEVV